MKKAVEEPQLAVSTWRCPQTQPCLVNRHEGAGAEGGSEEGWGETEKERLYQLIDRANRQ